ncbi:CDP-glucose 4,6-dehydratase [Butyrivibrio sp. AC2005]|uniref:CDP-glucose 4,6-dehydratase n=1 Tax=Butyrivibrio sp. AC2005 TaxID=1280672 RepID=UPI000414DA46|nr:CDP-glucose 4,6-dehydratase [Butyrivibrio sp. AC2005]
MNFEKMKDFYNGKRVFLTGHTGFKGSWLCVMLQLLGADVCGYSLAPNTDPDLFGILGLADEVHHTIGDIRDFDALEKAYIEANPDVVLHLAAQPIVRDSYKDPRYTYETNVMGTVNILECLRNHPGAVSFLNVTTDKVYENNDIENHGFKEDEKLDGFDPYSNSKSCSELVTHSYKKSFFAESDSTAISTARAGNVIGGGDFANDRIVPDCVRATVKGESIIVRNPYSTRPYQHVLEPLAAYLMIAMEQASDKKYADYYNIGPRDEDCINTGDLADYFVKYWGEPANWKNMSEANAPHEASFLKLDCAKARETFGWEPVWHVDEAIRETVAWYKAWNDGKDMKEFTRKQIREFINNE